MLEAEAMTTDKAELVLDDVEAGFHNPATEEPPRCEADGNAESLHNTCVEQSGRERVQVSQLEPSGIHSSTGMPQGPAHFATQRLEQNPQAVAMHSTLRSSQSLQEPSF